MSTNFSIITPAFNESEHVEQTVRSVLNQTILPQEWIIVDDGSTDNTAEIIQKYSRRHTFIKYIYRERPVRQEYFSSNVLAIITGYEQIKDSQFDLLAILDADIALPKNYYEYILSKFQSDKQLGIASGIYDDLIDGKPQKVLHDRRSTPKAIQVFRRQVFEQIGGFLPLPYGGEDTISCFMARMSGWKVWSFPEISALHLKPTGTGQTTNALAVRFKQGICEYNLATHPLFFFLKSCRRALLEKPYIIGSISRISGYLWASLRGDKTLLSKDVIKYIRKDQVNRIFNGNKAIY